MLPFLVFYTNLALFNYLINEHEDVFFDPASQGARGGLFLSVPLNMGPHRIPIIGM